MEKQTKRIRDKSFTREYPISNTLFKPMNLQSNENETIEIKKKAERKKRLCQLKRESTNINCYRNISLSYYNTTNATFY